MPSHVKSLNINLLAFISKTHSNKLFVDERVHNKLYRVVSLSRSKVCDQACSWCRVTLSCYDSITYLNAPASLLVKHQFRLIWLKSVNGMQDDASLE